MMMLFAVSALKGYAIEASDGTMGKVSDFLFEDNTWNVRWMVVDTGTWLTERKVLIAPYAISPFNHDQQEVHVKLSRAQVEASPEVTRDQPVSRQMEAHLYSYYQWEPYWAGGDMGMAGPAVVPPFVAAATMEANDGESTPDRGDPNLRSVDDVQGYHLQAADGEIGHLENFLIDEASWAIKYLIIATTNWLPGNRILILPETVRQINGSEGQVRIGLTREEVQTSPRWNQADLIDPGYEETLHGQFG
jgi:hypothetical protein